jgi:hypothetical protein
MRVLIAYALICFALICFALHSSPLRAEVAIDEASQSVFQRVEVEQGAHPADHYANRYAYWTAKVSPGGRFDQVGLHRFGQADGNGAVVLYLPGTNMNSRPTDLEEQHNLLLYLANRDVVVYGLDYRTASVPIDYAGDVGFFRDWTMSRFVDDAQLAFEFVRKQHPNADIYLAGFSRGVSYAYALAGRVKASGLIALDGGFKNPIVEVYDRQVALAKLDQSGRYASILSERRGWPGRQAMLSGVISNPAGEASDDRFASAGDQLAQTLYRAWGVGGLANPIDGVSDVQTLARLMLGYDRFFPVIQDIERSAVSSVLDDPASTLDDHFGELGIPVIYFGATGLGADHLLNGIYSAGKSGASKSDIHVLENYGHLDVLVGNQARVEVFDVLLRWLGQQS